MKKYALIFLFVLNGSVFANTQTLQQGIAAYHSGNFQVAKNIFQKLANDGNAEGLHMLASLYFQGHGVKKDIFKSIELFHAAAEKDYPAALANLGVIYQEGRFVEANKPLSFQYFFRAAKLGNKLAMFNTAQNYRKGQGVERNYKEAAFWYKVLAKRGDIFAQNEYGLLYAHGQGVPLDYVEAYAWISMSAESGNKQAIKNKAQLLSILNAKDKLRAIKLAEKYKSKYQRNGR